MVLQVFADTRQVVDDLDICRAQNVHWTNARKLQQLRRANGASRQNGLPHCPSAVARPRDDVAHPGHPAALDDELCDQRIADRRQVLRRCCRMQIGLRRAATPIALDRCREIAASGDIGTVQFGIEGNARLLAGCEKHLGRS
jgi:hypothetical protein